MFSMMTILPNIARMHHMALAAARKDELVWREDVLQHSGAFHSTLVSA